MGLGDIVKNQIKNLFEKPQNELSSEVDILKKQVSSGEEAGALEKAEKIKKSIETVRSAPEEIIERKKQIDAAVKVAKTAQIGGEVLKKSSTIGGALNPAAAAIAVAQELLIDKFKTEVAELESVLGVVDPLVANFKKSLSRQEQRINDLIDEMKLKKRIRENRKNNLG